jgi:hypothetical protein
MIWLCADEDTQKDSFAAAEPESSPTASIPGHTTNANITTRTARLAATIVLRIMLFTEIPLTCAVDQCAYLWGYYPSVTNFASSSCD